MRTTKQLHGVRCVQRSIPKSFLLTISGLLCALLSTVGASPVIAADRFSQEVEFDIPSQPVESALIEFSKQAGVQVMIDSQSLGGKRSSVLRGKFSATAALTELLRNTGLTYDTVGNAVAVKPLAAATTEVPVRPVVMRSTTARDDGYLTQKPSGNKGATKVDGRSEGVPQSKETLAEVLVTGSHIRGVTSSTPVLAISAAEIAQTGYATAQDWINTLPQNFGGSPSEEAGGVGNFNRGTGVNLRGLGAGATLVVVNGRRQPSSGQNGDFVDISSVPASAIERVEVVTDGASAVYGSDAIGGVVNIILRKDFNGAETRLRYASADGSASERIASQLFGTTWSGGHALLDYQYYERSPLLYADRDYAASADKRSFGGTDFRSPNSNPGNILNPSTGSPAFAIPYGQDGRALTPSALLPGVVNLQNPSDGATLLPRRKMHSVYLTAAQRIGDLVEVFGEGRFNRRYSSLQLPAESQNLLVPRSNPFFVDTGGGSQSVQVAYSFLDDFGPIATDGETDTYTGTAGATLSFSTDWRIEGAVSYGKENLHFVSSFINFSALTAALADSNPATAFNPFGDGSNTPGETLDALRSEQLERGVTDIVNPNLIADGSVFSLPGGRAKLAIGADYRSEHLRRESLTTRLDFGRQIKSTFVEIAMPFVSSSNARVGVHELELSAAGRYESYSDFGSTLNPKISLRYAPINTVQLRGSWGTSFRAPLLFDLESRSRLFNSARLVSLPDPLSPTGRSLVLFRIGGNESLKEETATNWTAGLDFSVSPNVSMSVTYYDIHYKDRILTPGPANVLNVLFQESQWSSIVARSPSRSDIDAICNDPVFVGSRPACMASTPAAVVDFRKQNIATTKVSGIDLLIDMLLPTKLGDFGFGFNGSYVLGYEVAASDQMPFVDVVDTINNQVALRLRATGSWRRAGYAASLSLNHVGSYDDNSRAPAIREIDAWNTVDVRLSYEVSKSAGWLGGIELALSAANVFDEDPPFTNQLTGYDFVNATPVGRFLAFQVTKNW